MRTVLVPRWLGPALVGALLASGCSSGADDDAGPRVVVTTSILGDLVGELVGDAAEVEVVMGRGADPHRFSPSVRQGVAMREAEVLVVNGLGLEAGLEDTIEAAADDGVPVLAVAELAPDHLHADDHGSEDHAGHDHDGEDPHVLTDPARMAVAVERLGDALAATLPEGDRGAIRERVASYAASLRALDAELEEAFAPIPEARRALVTSHDVLGYFADRYGFRVVGSIRPALTTEAEPSARDVAELIAVVEDAEVPAVFVEAGSSDRLAEVLADAGRDVAVVELHLESLGPPGSPAATYLGLLRENGRRIAAALGAPATMAP